MHQLQGDETRQEVRWCKYRKIEVNCMERPQQFKGWLICSTLMFTLYQQLIPWNMQPIRTSHHTPIGVLHLGLIGQFHYQALEKIEDHCSTPDITSAFNDQPTLNANSSSRYTISICSSLVCMHNIIVHV